MQLHDLVEQPNFNYASQQGRGDWSLRDVSTGQVRLNSVTNTPDCADHGAMNSVSPQKDIWRCLTCGRACYITRAR